MNIHARFTEEADIRMTLGGAITIPEAIRRQAGLVPGGQVHLGVNDQGEVILTAGEPNPKETGEQRSARIRAALEAARGTVDLGFGSTDEYMDFIRPYRHDPL